MAALLLAPFLLDYQVILRDTYGFSRPLDEIRGFSADVAGLLLAPEDLLLWGWVHVIQRPESSLFPGVAIVLLAGFAIFGAKPFAIAGRRIEADADRPRGACRDPDRAGDRGGPPIVYGTWRLTIGGVRSDLHGSADKPLALALAAAMVLMATLPRVRAAFRGRSPLAFYLLAALAMWVLALGPEPTVMDRPALSQSPYGWLMGLPGFDGLRVPARFWMMALACLSVVAALAVHRLDGRARRIVVSHRRGRAAARWMAPDVHRAPARRRFVGAAGVTTRLDLPITTTPMRGRCTSRCSTRSRCTTASAATSRRTTTLFACCSGESDPRVLDVLAAAGPLGIVIDHDGRSGRRLRRFVLANPGAAVVRTEQRLEQLPDPGRPPPRLSSGSSGLAAAIKSLSTFPSPPHAGRALDGDLRTRWSGGVQQQSAEAIIELEQPRRMSGRWSSISAGS